MGIRSKRPVPAVALLRQTLQVSKKARRNITRSRENIAHILEGMDKRFLVIVGPCSAWPSEAVLEYAKRLAALKEELGDKLLIVMRVYTQKPRTTKGWAGVIVQPDPYAKPSVAKGARYVRRMMREVADLELPIADELLFTHKADWIGDLLSWAAIGARSAEDQEHRIFASGLSVPVGMKNPTCGDLSIGVNSVVSAQAGHTYYSHGYEINTDGNPHAHLVLRGGTQGPNYSAKHAAEAATHMKKSGVANPAILIDASHDNTKKDGKKDHMRQIDVVKAVLRAREDNKEYKKLVKGVLIESYLQSGCQRLDNHTKETVNRDGLSVTDPCLGWEETEKLLREMYQKL